VTYGAKTAATPSASASAATRTSSIVDMAGIIEE
jgi:hypothetical protein